MANLSQVEGALLDLPQCAVYVPPFSGYLCLEADRLSLG